MIFYLSSLPQVIFNTVQLIFNKFTKGDLKGQRLVKSKNKDNQGYDLKGSNFKCLRNIEYDVVASLLQQVSDKNISLSELSSKCMEIKQLNKIRASFVKGTNTENWSEAKEKFPNYSSDEQLLTFKKLSFNSSKLPDEFMLFCRMAVSSKSNSSSSFTATDNEQFFACTTTGGNHSLVQQHDFASFNPLDLSKLFEKVRKITI